MSFLGRRPTLSDVYITAELDRRPVKRADHLREKLALQDLAARLADHPEEILPRFVDLAMGMTGGVAAGLSLLEEKPAPGVFRWRYLRGQLSRFENATTPRNFSPCGVTLDENGPVLSLHPERAYDWIAAADIEVPEVLLVPLRLDRGDPLGTLWIVSDQEQHFHRGHARALTELAAFVGVAVRMLRTEERLKHALEQQQTLASEMSHRLQNVFAITDGMIRTSARKANSAAELADSLIGRINALASAHALVSREILDEGRPQRRCDLGDLIHVVLSPYDQEGEARAVLEGPPVECGDAAITNVALVVHELATNAAKYGALASRGGRVAVRWRRDADLLRLEWDETGGPTIAARPARDGFGSALMRRTVADQLGGTLARDWASDGLKLALAVPIASFAH